MCVSAAVRVCPGWFGLGVDMSQTDTMVAWQKSHPEQAAIPGDNWLRGVVRAYLIT